MKEEIYTLLLNVDKTWAIICKHPNRDKYKVVVPDAGDAQMAALIVKLLNKYDHEKENGTSQEVSE